MFLIHGHRQNKFGLVNKHTHPILFSNLLYQNIELMHLASIGAVELHNFLDHDSAITSSLLTIHYMY